MKIYRKKSSLLNKTSEEIRREGCYAVKIRNQDKVYIINPKTKEIVDDKPWDLVEDPVRLNPEMEKKLKDIANEVIKSKKNEKKRNPRP